LKSSDEALTEKVLLTDFAAAVGISARTLFYWRAEAKRPKLQAISEPGLHRAPPNKLTSTERKEVIEVLRRPDWAEFSPREIYYKMLDEEGKLLASISTIYRISRKEQLMQQRSKMNYVGTKISRPTPHLTATGPNEIWSWDVTQIASTQRTCRFYLYVIVDIWSRYVVGWTLEEHEMTSHAIKMWKDALESQVISGSGLTNHKDNGTIMTSAEMIKFVKDARMINSYSRVGVSDDNPFSESLFRTIKYFRNFPERFSTLIEGRKYFEKYFRDYNDEFRHSGIQFMPPVERHYGEELKILTARNKAIQIFYNEKRHRYSSQPKEFKPIIEVKIN
jgi:transposase InsO family protein